MVVKVNIGLTRRRYESVAAMIVGTHKPEQLVDEVQSGIDARKELDELKAKLPKTADGVPVVPGMDAWCVDDQGPHQWLVDAVRWTRASGNTATGWFHDVPYGPVDVNACYSTQAAAAAGKE